MRNVLGIAFVTSVLLAGPVAAQQDARAVLQAADQAIGASKVNSFQFTGKGRYSYLGQNYTPNDDWNRVDLQNYVLTIDYPSKSYKEEEVRVQGNNPKIGGGAGFPIEGEQRASVMASGNYAWTVNAQGQPQPQNTEAETRQLFIAVSPHGFIKAAMADREAQVSTRHFVKTGQYRPANSAFPSIRVIAPTRISMLPLSSTGIWFSSVRSPPPYTWPFACGYVPKSCGAKSNLKRPDAE